MRKEQSITIVGAGSSRTPALVGSIVDYKERFKISQIVFYDIDTKRTSKMETYIRLVLKQEIPSATVIFTTDKTVAYKDADAV
ncbi:MAG: 6-phospho-alpha-glucosidase, partial [Erysipelothrix sp.]